MGQLRSLNFVLSTLPLFINKKVLFLSSKNVFLLILSRFKLAADFHLYV